MTSSDTSVEDDDDTSLAALKFSINSGDQFIGVTETPDNSLRIIAVKRHCGGCFLIKTWQLSCKP